VREFDIKRMLQDYAERIFAMTNGEIGGAE
jgi:hypothetical protein